MGKVSLSLHSERSISGLHLS